MKNKVGRRKSQCVVASSIAAAGNSGLSTPRTQRGLKDAFQKWPAEQKAGTLTPFFWLQVAPGVCINFQAMLLGH